MVLSALLLRDVFPFTIWSSQGQGNGKIPFIMKLETVLSQGGGRKRANFRYIQAVG